MHFNALVLAWTTLISVSTERKTSLSYLPKPLIGETSHIQVTYGNTPQLPNLPPSLL